MTARFGFVKSFEYTRPIVFPSKTDLTAKWDSNLISRTNYTYVFG